MLRHLTAVDERMEPRQETPWRTLPFLILLHTRSGDATWEHAGGLLRHAPGTLVALAPGLRHRQIVGATWWHTGYLLLAGPWLTTISAALNRRGGVVVLENHQRDHAGRRELDRALLAIWEKSAGWDWACGAALAELLGRVQAATDDDHEHLPLAERLTRLLDRDPIGPWPVAVMARRLGMAASTLAHRCATETGLAPAAWIRRHRAHRARALLAAGLSVTATSERLGFANPYHFARIIRTELGVPPSHLRTVHGPGPLSRER